MTSSEFRDPPAGGYNEYGYRSQKRLVPVTFEKIHERVDEALDQRGFLDYEQD